MGIQLEGAGLIQQFCQEGAWHPPEPGRITGTAAAHQILGEGKKEGLVTTSAVVSLFKKTDSSHKVEETAGELFSCKTRMYYEADRTVEARNFPSDGPFFRPLPILQFGIGSYP